MQYKRTRTLALRIDQPERRTEMLSGSRFLPDDIRDSSTRTAAPMPVAAADTPELQ
jgi:hypothetical protein